MVCSFPERSGGVSGSGARALGRVPPFVKGGRGGIGFVDCRDRTGSPRSWSPGAARQLVTFLVLPRKVTQRRRPRCAAADAGPWSGTGKRGCATRPGRAHKACPAAELEQCSPQSPLSCTRSAGRRTGDQRYRVRCAHAGCVWRPRRLRHAGKTSGALRLAANAPYAGLVWPSGIIGLTFASITFGAFFQALLSITIAIVCFILAAMLWF